MDPQLVAFIVISGLLTLTPGADTMLVVRNVLSGGRSSGVTTTLGICSGLFVHATLSALGLSVILVRSAAAYELVKTAGAIYLIYLGGRSLYLAIRGVHPAPQAQTLPAEGRAKPAGRSFVEGFLNNVLNPKVAIFYLAFLPQFIHVNEAVLPKSLLLAGIHAIEGLAWLGLLSFLLDKSRAFIQGSGFKRWLEGISGAVLVGLGIRLAFERR